MSRSLGLLFAEVLGPHRELPAGGGDAVEL
jgi:hypothetical protein